MNTRNNSKTYATTIQKKSPEKARCRGNLLISSARVAGKMALESAELRTDQTDVGSGRGFSLKERASCVVLAPTGVGTRRSRAVHSAVRRRKQLAGSYRHRKIKAPIGPPQDLQVEAHPGLDRIRRRHKSKRGLLWNPEGSPQRAGGAAPHLSRCLLLRRSTAIGIERQHLILDHQLCPTLKHQLMLCVGAL